jgi:hypothetical protein
MMLPQCSHITRKRGVYYYRRRLPGFAKGEVAVSLRTRSFREAQWFAARLDHEFGRIIASVNKNKKTSDIQRIARDYLRSKLAFDMERRVASPNSPVYDVGFDPRDSRQSQPGGEVADRLSRWERVP